MMSLLLAGILFAASSGPTDRVQFADKLWVQGETAQRLGRAYDRLTSPPLNDPTFTLSDVSFALTRRFTEYSGDISGRVLTALDDATPLLGRQPDIIPALLAGFAKYQKPDGHFGADQQLEKEVNQQRDTPILWGNGRLLFGLARHCKDDPVPKLLEVARKLGDYICSTRKYYGKEENFKAVGGAYASGFTTCYPSMVDGLVALAEVTGDRKYADEARFIANLSLLDDAFDKHHSHGRLSTYRGMLDLDYLTGTRDFVDKVRAYCAKVTTEYELPTGGVSEVFNRDHAMDEGCTEADWLWVHLLLWRSTGEAVHLDHAEHILRNHVLATQFPNGGFGHWWLLGLKDGGKIWYGGGFHPRGAESYWCCAMHGTQALAETARHGVLTQGEKIVITWLAEVEADVRVGERTLHVVAKRTGPRAWQVRVDSSAPGDIAFRLRVPGWAKTINVDGKPTAGRQGWAEVVRPLAREQAFIVRFPQEVRLEGAYSREPVSGEPVRIFSGPDLYCLPDDKVLDGMLAADEVPAIVLPPLEDLAEADLPTDYPGGFSLGIAPRAVLEGAKGTRQEATLLPMAIRMPGGCRYLFKVRRVDRATFNNLAKAAAPAPSPGKPVQLIFACDGDFELYLNGRKVGSGSGANQELVQVAYTNQPQNVLTVRVRSKAQRPALIGLIRAGGKAYVTDTEHWTATRSAATLPADWMTDAKAERPGQVKLDDLGTWGVDPWKHIVAQFAGTDAHWIWPADYKSPQWYAVRHVFTIP